MIMMIMIKDETEHKIQNINMLACCDVVSTMNDLWCYTIDAIEEASL